MVQETAYTYLHDMQSVNSKHQHIQYLQVLCILQRDNRLDGEGARGQFWLVHQQELCLQRLSHAHGIETTLQQHSSTQV